MSQKLTSSFNVPSLYVHVPFCSHICSYCAFSKTANTGRIDAWLNTLEQEIRIAAPVYETDSTDSDKGESSDQRQPGLVPGRFFQTIYIGGGTPSALDEEQTARLLQLLEPFRPDESRLAQSDLPFEWTIEANPESLTAKKIRLWKKAGINRVSLGIQTFNDERLAQIGRYHTADESRKAVELLKAEGIENICADLMYGFPGESLEELDRDIDAFLELEIDHLSIYSLILEDGTLLARQISAEDIDGDLCAAMYERIEERLTKASYVHYEVSSYARNGRYGLHNTLIWEDGRYAALGWGACGRDEKGLYDHARRFDDYLKDPSARIYEDDPNPSFDALMTGLRTIWGVDLDAWQKRYGIDFYGKYKAVLDRWKNDLIIENGRLGVSRQGMERLDSILVDFLDAE